MNLYATNITHKSFWYQINAVCFILGLILAAAVFTANQISRTGKGPSVAGFTYDWNRELRAATEKKDADYEAVLKQKNDYITKLETRLSRGNSATSLITKTLQETKFNAGLTEALGPGVQVTLTDSAKPPLVGAEGMKLNILIHDSDLNSVVNELKACGAEAISVNGQRIVASTAIRCVGPVIHVNGVPSAPPFIVQAIGDPEGLYSGMNLPGGVITELRKFDPDMIRIEKRSALRLPAFGGSPVARFARPPAPLHTEAEKESN
jgi:uncharacterized protein YlxW (UPF0749 family)